MTLLSKAFIESIRQIIVTAQQHTESAIQQQRVLMYWHIGNHIVEEEQQGKTRADYGKELIKNLAQELTEDFGSGFSFRQLNFCRQFFIAFPIMNALRSQLNWTQYRLLLRIENEDKSAYK